MDNWKLPWDGGCRCGQTRFRVTKPPLLAAACHCSGCQAMTASAFSLSLAVMADGFEIVAGEPVLGGLAQDQHHFCPRCMSWMFTRPAGLDWLVNVRATLLDAHDWYVPYVETCASEKLPWAATTAKHSFDQFPDEDGWAPLIEGYAKEGARPG